MLLCRGAALSSRFRTLPEILESVAAPTRRHPQPHPVGTKYQIFAAESVQNFETESVLTRWHQISDFRSGIRPDF